MKYVIKKIRADHVEVHAGNVRVATRLGPNALVDAWKFIDGCIAARNAL